MEKLGDEFKWWFGIVEDINDPLKLGRVRVRVFGWHSEDKGKIPTADLPWAQPIQDITSAALGNIGKSPTGMLVNTWVVGFFMDGDEGQRPIIMGSVAGVPGADPDVDARARGINNVSKKPDSVIDEPADPFAAVYPNNHTHRTKAGHLIELDDSSGAERIHIYHKSGSFVEMHPDGSVVIHAENVFESISDTYKLHAKNMDVVVDEDLTWTIGGDVTESIGGDHIETVVGDVVEIYKSQTITAVEGITIAGGTTLAMAATVITVTGIIGMIGSSTLNVTTDGNINFSTIADVNITGDSVNITETGSP